MRLLLFSPSCRGYRKVPKFSDTKKLYCNLPKIQSKRPNLRVFCQNDANRIANSEDPDQTAPGEVFTVCADISVRKIMTSMVHTIICMPAGLLEEFS